MENFIKTLLKDIQVDLTQEFDRNFERKAFFNEKWKKTKFNYNNGSLLQRSGKLRRSITATTNSNSIKFKSNMPYARIRNDQHLYGETLDRLFFIPTYLYPPSAQEADAIFKLNGLNDSEIAIVSGKSKNQTYNKKFSWHNKPTYRGIRDVIMLIKDARLHHKTEQKFLAPVV